MTIRQDRLIARRSCPQGCAQGGDNDKSSGQTICTATGRPQGCAQGGAQ